MFRSEVRMFRAPPMSMSTVPLGTISESVEECSDDHGETRALGRDCDSSPSFAALLTQTFDPSKITVLDLSDIQDALLNIFIQGCLPDWLRNFSNLEVLKAAKCGLVIVDPWLAHMTALREIYLEHNLISTWPYFLQQLPSLEYLCLDGNPCLEKAFCKSPSLRALFFNWGPSKDAYKCIPRYVRGPEWPVAATARVGPSLNIANFGSYFGGIYTLAVPPDTSNEGFLTPMEPCPLQTRLLAVADRCRGSVIEAFANADAAQRPHIPPITRRRRQSQILFTIFSDIQELLHRSQALLAKAPARQLYVPVTGHVDIDITSTPSTVHASKKKIDTYAVLWTLLKEEEHYCSELRRAIKQFFSSSIRSSTVVESLSTIFEWFPHLCGAHHKSIYPALRLLVSASASKSKDSVREKANALCTAMLEAQNSYEWYARRLNTSECYLDMPSSCAGLYRDAELQEHVRKQVMKLGGMNAYLSIQFPNASNTNTMDYINRRRSYDVFKSKRDRGPVAEWAEKELSKPGSKIDKHPSEYVFLPLFHIVRYERVFTVLSHIDSDYDDLKTTCRKIRRHVAYRRRTAQINARSKLLTSKFRTSSDAFQGYKWDAVLVVASRSYLEKGLLEPKTVDVFDEVLGEPASFVTEIFSEHNQRLLRLVCCGSLVQIWDEVFEHLVGTVDKSDIIATRVQDEKVQVVFAEVREICRAAVKEFSAPYVLLKTDAEEFVEAFAFDKYMI